jgi:very-long-chain ceramide synthase
MKHILGKRQNDYIEMMLHHTITIYLLFGSYLYNIWECGAIISLIHDASDVPGHLSKAFIQTTLDKITIPLSLFMMAAWFYLRNLMLPFCIYHVWNQGLIDNAFDKYLIPVYGVTMPIYCYLLSLLVILHYYWFSLFLRMLWRALNKISPDDIQNDMSKNLIVKKDK